MGHREGRLAEVTRRIRAHETEGLEGLERAAVQAGGLPQLRAGEAQGAGRRERGSRRYVRVDTRSRDLLTGSYSGSAARLTRAC